MLTSIIRYRIDPTKKLEFVRLARNWGAEIPRYCADLVDDVEGFLSVERFQSLTDPDKLLSLSLFEDEAAVARGRRLSAHRSAQTRGRGGIFADYHLRIAHVIRDYGMFDRNEAPGDSKAAHG